LGLLAGFVAGAAVMRLGVKAGTKMIYEVKHDLPPEAIILPTEQSHTEAPDDLEEL
jgi:hypothetical protein